MLQFYNFDIIESITCTLLPIDYERCTHINLTCPCILMKCVTCTNLE